jgi:hypothetical protein
MGDKSNSLVPIDITLVRCSQGLLAIELNKHPHFHSFTRISLMLKIAPLALGLLTVLSIVPNAQAYPLPQHSSQPQLAIIVGGQQPIYRGQPGYRNSQYNHRAVELRRFEIEREHQRELAAERRRRQYYSRHRNHGSYNNGQYNTGVYNAGIYRAPVNDRDGYNNRGGYEDRYDNHGNGSYNNQGHHNR